MSTDLQLKGNSRRRQLEASRAYADAHGLELAEGGELEDIGISAFKGANVREGALGRFLEAVKIGAVKPGSYLLVESLDRLSRQELLAAQVLFLSIIQAGINLVTLADKRVFPAGTNNLGDLVYSLVLLSSAHEESLNKSRRVADAWKSKRSSAVALKPMTKWCPGWLMLSADKRSYVPIPDRVKVVQQIFQDSAEGIGIYRIANRLNEANFPTFNKSQGWHQSYVAKILSNRAVLGEFQPGARKEGKRVHEGEPIKGYFPAIVAEELFHRAQHGLSQRRINGAGRKGIGYSNIFSGLATCAYCKATMVLENKGQGAKGGHYLICSAARRRFGCKGVRWRYRDFETSFLRFVEEINFIDIVDSESEDKQARLTEKISALQGELASMANLMNKAFQVLEGGPVEFVRSKLNELQARCDELTGSIATATSKLQNIRAQATQIDRSKDEIKGFIRKLQDTRAQNIFDLRAKLASRLKSLIDQIDVAPTGQAPINGMIAKFLSEDSESNASLRTSIEETTASHRAAVDDTQDLRFFVVRFKSGHTRVVWPSSDDPLQFEQRISPIFEIDGERIQVA